MTYDNLKAFLPMYEDGLGDVTLVFDSQGKEIVEVKSKAYLKRILRYFFLDYHALKYRYGEILNVRNLLPIPLAGDVLVPFKARKNPIGGDGSFGYYSLNSFEDFVEEGETTLILLEGGVELKAMTKIASNRNHLSKAIIMKKII